MVTQKISMQINTNKEILKEKIAEKTREKNMKNKYSKIEYPKDYERFNSLMKTLDAEKVKFLITGKDGKTAEHTFAAVDAPAETWRLLAARDAGALIKIAPESREHNYIVVSGLTESSLKAMRGDGYGPALTTETEQGRFQAVFKVRRGAEGERKEIAETLAARYGNGRQEGITVPGFYGDSLSRIPRIVSCNEAAPALGPGRLIEKLKEQAPQYAQQEKDMREAAEKIEYLNKERKQIFFFEMVVQSFQEVAETIAKMPENENPELLREYKQIVRETTKKIKEVGEKIKKDKTPEDFEQISKMTAEIYSGVKELKELDLKYGKHEPEQTWDPEQEPGPDEPEPQPEPQQEPQQEAQQQAQEAKQDGEEKEQDKEPEKEPEKAPEPQQAHGFSILSALWKLLVAIAFIARDAFVASLQKVRVPGLTVKEAKEEPPYWRDKSQWRKEELEQNPAFSKKQKLAAEKKMEPQQPTPEQKKDVQAKVAEIKAAARVEVAEQEAKQAKGRKKGRSR